MPDLNRRGILAGTAALAVGVSACSAPTQQAPSAQTTTGSAPATSTSPAAPASGATTTLGVNSVRVADVPVGGGVVLQHGSFVITQPTAGEFKAFSKTCPHQGCPVSRVVGTEVVCACHNSHFDITDGHVVSGPSRQGLLTATASVENGVVTGS